MSTDEQLIAVFKEMDTNNDGALSREEIKKFLVDNGFDNAFIEEFIVTLDENADGKVTFDEYTQKLGGIPKGERGVSHWKKVFKHFDKDNSGFLEVSELPKILEEANLDSSSFSAQDFKDWVAEMDVDGDGKINYNEFLKFIKDLQ